MSNNDFIFNLKLSELCLMKNIDKRLVRITGRVDLENGLNDDKQLVIYSLESIETLIPNKFLKKNGLDFIELNEANIDIKDDTSLTEFKCLVDLTYLNDFNLNDMNPQHDSIQFLGYKDSTSTVTNCKFRAIYHRILKRINQSKYYASLQIQNSYLNRKI